MVFSSSIFLFYFLPIFLLAYFITPFSHKNKTALLASLLFYLWGSPMFGFILILSIIIDFYLGNQIFKSVDRKKKKRLLAMSVLLNVGLLVYFKYANFFIENVNTIAHSLGIESVSWIEIILPIGISFFTFQKLSYIIDVYVGKDQPLKKLSDYALYILLFPQLIAGPIVRFNEIASQIKERRNAHTIDNKLNGIFRFTIGLSKKLLIANTLGEQVDQVFGSSISELGATDAWIVIIAYAFQIYYDFSGYSDMAIGIGLMLGFRFPENFNFPYISRSITEFWRRWHITLSNWMRDYLYIPLGGNHISQSRTYVNLCLVFLISGLWHGAAWTFVLWGVFHGLFLILDRLFLKNILDNIGSFLSLTITFFFILLGWVIFRAETYSMAIDYYTALFSIKTSVLTFSNHFWAIFFIASIFVITPAFFRLEKKLASVYNTIYFKGLLLKILATIVLLTLCITEVEVSSFNPFIYFRF
ncbi:MAG: alginate O-acetyltransferase complex protein AlgI [Saprospiraceae bacterium]|jgi:alginate O-acetyltransferase complex protein AlgI